MEGRRPEATPDANAIQKLASRCSRRPRLLPDAFTPSLAPRPTATETKCEPPFAWALHSRRFRVSRTQHRARPSTAVGGADTRQAVPRVSTHPVHVDEVDDGDELAIQGVRRQVDEADAAQLDVALRRGEREGAFEPRCFFLVYGAKGDGNRGGSGDARAGSARTRACG
jgi:hypothetical protein